ncbi:DUF4402 domain-containing protein [Croceibacter atlanticus]|jgi:hypothetical protein|uniref:DUF4402 domain-containing protein n=2 Tax=Croceibacter TaxID=216431 RepID=A3U9E5_CROAH|nr:DUF4402 domain-containing protein [Croceibacter atlanticus]EAP86431.1 hypothetical protein CA2559_10363 [Croceibacter atlanticus HTCC2559]MBW4971092.1 DUF4402 domain-containing protein [Croceibacter atlanticus]
MNNLKVLLILFLCSTYTYSIGQTILAQNIEPYNFGMFTLGGQSSGVLNLTENSTLTTSQNITVLNQSTISAAKFLVTTTSVFPINVSISTSDVYLVNQFNETILLQPELPNDESFNISVLNPLTVSLGASLLISNNSPGHYNGDVEVMFIINSE